MVYKLQQKITMDNAFLDMFNKGPAPHKPNKENSFNISEPRTRNDEPQFLLEDSSIEPRRQNESSVSRNTFDEQAYLNRQRDTESMRSGQNHSNQNMNASKGSESIEYSRDHRLQDDNVIVRDTTNNNTTIPEPVPNRSTIKSEKKDSKCSLM